MPHTNADPERGFSAMNYLKNAKKNALHPKTVSAVIRAKEVIRSQEKGCFEDDMHFNDKTLFFSRNFHCSKVLFKYRFY